MPIVIDGTGTITGISAGGLPDATITQPELATGVGGTGPAFSAYKSGSRQTIANATFTKVTLTSEKYDTANCWDTTNSRFTPNVAGYYHFSSCILMDSSFSSPDVTNCLTSIYKNGARFQDVGYFLPTTTLSATMLTGSCDVYLNGTTDYIEIYAYGASTNNLLGVAYDASGVYTYLQGYLARAA